VKPNGFLIDFGVDHEGQVVVMDAGDVLQPGDDEKGHLGKRFAEILFLPSFFSEFVDGVREPRLVESDIELDARLDVAFELISDGRLRASTREAALTDDPQWAPDTYPALQRMKEQMIPGMFGELKMDGPLARPVLYRGNYELDQRVRVARLQVIGEALEGALVRYREANFQPELALDTEGSKKSSMVSELDLRSMNLEQELWFDPGEGRLNISWDQLRWHVTPFPRGASGLVFRVDDKKTGKTFVLRASGGQENLDTTRQALIDLRESRSVPEFFGEVMISGHRFLVVEHVNGPNLMTMLEYSKLPETVGRELGRALVGVASKGRVMGDSNNLGNYVWDGARKEVRIVDVEWTEDWKLSPETARDYLKTFIHDYWHPETMPQVLEWNETKRKNLEVLREAVLAELDKAMSMEEKKSELGGIDFNDNRLQLNVADDGRWPAPAFRLDGLPAGGIGGAGSFQGLIPVILEIKPAANLRTIMGLSDKPEGTQS